MKKYKCTLCSYVYDPQSGDPENSVVPGTAFEDLPDGWVCPECGADKDAFEQVWADSYWTDEKAYPKQRPYEKFKEWFDIELCSEVIDFVDGKIKKKDI